MTGQKERRCYCYIVECADGSYYTGWTTDPVTRLKAHNAGSGSRYTRSRRPVRLVHLERQSNPSSAMQRERTIKTMTRSQKTRLIAGPPDGRGKTNGKRRRELGGAGQTKPQRSIRE